MAQGGAVSVSSFTNTSVTGSDFRGNAAVGGSGGAGEPIPFVDNQNLARFGGAIQLAGEPSSTVADDSFESNTAKGGNGGPGLSGGTGEGGAINGDYTILTLSDLSFAGNQAVGGRGGDAGSDSMAAGGSGGQAVGGAVAYFDFYGDQIPPPPGRTAIVSGIESSGDRAIGGSGGTGDGPGTGGTGGDALGGGLWNGGFLTLSSSHFSGDRAQGGTGGAAGNAGAGGAGGNGDGGAVASGVVGTADDSLALSIDDSMLNGNKAAGGAGGYGTTDGSPGMGDGGAIAILARPATITRSKFAGNKASTTGDDIYGSYTS
jgi:hypothetical protein